MSNKFIYKKCNMRYFLVISLYVTINRYGQSTIRHQPNKPFNESLEIFPDGLNTIRLPESELTIPFEFEIELPPMYQRVPKDYDKIYREFHKAA